MKIKLLITICFVFTLNLLKSQEQNSYNNPSIGWSINLPKDFTNKSKGPVQIVETKNKTEVKKEANRNSSEKSESITFQGKNKTFLFSTLEKYKSELKYSDFVKRQTDDLVEGLKKQMPKAKFEITSTQEIIDSLNFYRNEIKIDLGNNIFQNFLIYNSLINDFNSNFLIVYLNPSTESQELIKAFKESKFSKK